MKVLAISSAVRDFHVYKPSISDKLTCAREFDNCFDKFTISVVNNGETVGHFSCKFSKIAQISCTPDFERSFRAKRCGLYAGVYGNFLNEMHYNLIPPANSRELK